MSHTPITPSNVTLPLEESIEHTESGVTEYSIVPPYPVDDTDALVVGFTGTDVATIGDLYTGAIIDTSCLTAVIIAVAVAASNSLVSSIFTGILHTSPLSGRVPSIVTILVAVSIEQLVTSGAIIVAVPNTTVLVSANES